MALIFRSKLGLDELKLQLVQPLPLDRTRAGRLTTTATADFANRRRKI